MEQSILNKYMILNISSQEYNNITYDNYTDAYRALKELIDNEIEKDVNDDLSYLTRFVIVQVKTEVPIKNVLIRNAAFLYSEDLDVTDALISSVKKEIEVSPKFINPDSYMELDDNNLDETEESKEINNINSFTGELGICYTDNNNEVKDFNSNNEIDKEKEEKLDNLIEGIIYNFEENSQLSNTENNEVVETNNSINNESTEESLNTLLQNTNDEELTESKEIQISDISILKTPDIPSLNNEVK